MKILKNTTLSAIDLVGLGITIPASSSFTVVVEDYVLLAGETSLAELDPLITAGNIVVNDGLVDLSSTDGKRYIRFPVTANQLRFDNSTNGFVSKNIQSAIEEASGLVQANYISATSTLSTTSTTYQNISDCNITPGAGSYIALFSCKAETTGVNTEAEFSLFKNSTQIADSLREVRNTTNILGLITLSTNNSAVPVVCVTKIDVNGTDVISPRYRHVSGGSVQVAARSLTLIKIGGFSGVGGSVTSNDHSALINLLVDTHTQYLLADGSRDLLGDLNFATNNILNVGTINGIDILSHGSRHLPSGSDPLTTAQAVSTSTVNTIGTANSFSRSDHTHNTVLTTVNAISTGEIQTTTSTYVLLTGTSQTISVTGTYDLSIYVLTSHQSNAGIGFFSIYKNGSVISDSEQEVRFDRANDRRGILLQTFNVICNSGDTIEGRWRRQSGTLVTFKRVVNHIRKS